MKTAILLVALASLWSCTDEASRGKTTHYQADAQSDASEPPRTPGSIESGNVRERGGVVYTANLLPAIDFVERSGDVIDAADRDDLATEQVLMLECALKKTHKDFWDSDKLLMSREDGMNYLVGQVAADIMIQQHGKTFIPNGVNFEGRSGAMNKIRLQLFFSGLKLNQPLKILYYDRLTGTGLVKFELNER
jgi:hypothetical protein